MVFENQIEIKDHDLQFTTRINPADKQPLRNVGKGNRSASAEIELNLNPNLLPADLEIKPLGHLAIAPLKARLSDRSDLETPIPVNLYFSEGEPLNFYVNLFSIEDYSNDAGLEVYGPPFRILEWGQKMLPSRRSIPIGAQDPVETVYGPTFGETLEDVSTSLNTEHPASAIDEFTNELGRWLPAWEVFYLIDRCKQANHEYDNYNDKDALTKSFAYDLINQSGSPDYEFQTWNEVVQFTDTTLQLSTLPSLEPEELVKKAFDLLFVNSTRRTYPLDLLWGLEQRFEISIHVLDELTEEQTNVLLAKSIIEGDHIRAKRIITALDAVPVEEDLDTSVLKANQAHGKEKLRRARNLLQPTLDADKTKFLEAAELYFDALRVQRDYPLPSIAAINKVQISIYQRLDRSNFERTARHYYTYHRGQRFLRVERYKEAAECLKQAVAEALDEHATHGDIHFTQLANPLIKYYRAVTERAYEENRFFEATQRLAEEAIPIVKQIDYFQGKEDEQEYTRKRLEAMYHEAEGDRHLQNQAYRKAVSQFGQSIALYHDTERSHEAEYLDNRKRAIEAALSEQEGNFEDAAEEHETIFESGDERDGYSQFHQTRAKICQSKEYILAWEFQRARQKLSEADVDWGIAGEEVQYLEMLLDELETFKAESTSDISRVLDELDRISLDRSEDFHVSYGHDYRPVFIHILAAQRLRQLGDMDEISDVLIKLSLSDVLRPTQVEQVLERHGLPDLQLDQHWMERVPIFTLKQYQEVENAEASKIWADNFKDQGDTLTASIEQYLQFIAEYHGCLEYGPDWPSHISESADGPALRPLVEFLNNNVFNDLQWIETVRKVLSQVKYGDIVMPWKEGDIIDVRNDIHHNNISYLSEEDFQAIKSDIETVYQETAVKIPVLGKVIGENKYGAYTLHLFIGGTDTRFEIKTDGELKIDEVYYFPSGMVSSSDPVPDIDSDDIVRCRSHRIRKGLDDYGPVEVELMEE